MHFAFRLQLYNTMLKPSVNYFSGQLTTVYSSLATCRDILSILQQTSLPRNSTDWEWYRRIVLTTVDNIRDAVRVINVFRATSAVDERLPKIQSQCANDLTKTSTLMSSFLENMLPIKGFTSDSNSTSDDKWPTEKAREAIEDIGQLLVAITDSLDCALAYSQFLDRVTNWISSLDVSQRNVSSSVDVEQSVIRFNRDEIWLRQTVVEVGSHQDWKCVRFSLASHAVARSNVSISTSNRSQVAFLFHNCLFSSLLFWFEVRHS